RGESQVHDQRGWKAASAPHLGPLRSPMGIRRIRPGTGADRRRTFQRTGSDGCVALRPDRPRHRRHLARCAGERDRKCHLLGMDSSRGRQLGHRSALARLRLVDGGLSRAGISRADLRRPCGSLRRPASRPRAGPDPHVSSSRPLAIPRTPDGTEAVRPGAQLPLTPNHHLRLEARAQALQWLTLSTGFDYVGSQYFRGDEANLAPKVAPYLILRTGAEAHWRAWTA